MNAIPGIKLIDGKATAARVLAEVREQVQELRQGGVQPGLAVVLVAPTLPARCTCATRCCVPKRWASARWSIACPPTPARPSCWP
jgi:methenyltetrahydrofolate cyclohydrolase (EC 3.5.4.9)/5,10-methylenetetrahydrofolate dehydrogenase (NADP+) (EC 1.5.1.5)